MDEASRICFQEDWAGAHLAVGVVLFEVFNQGLTISCVNREVALHREEPSKCAIELFCATGLAMIQGCRQVDLVDGVEFIRCGDWRCKSCSHESEQEGDGEENAVEFEVLHIQGLSG